jgi:putative tryptophan/tyrosine transport system substrate-binding protein
MAIGIGRRRFISALGGATVSWPLSVQAQQPAPMRRIGVLIPYPQDDAAVQPQLIAFRDALADLGWTIGRNVIFDYRWTAGSNDLVRTYAKELVTLAPDLILTESVQLVSALHDETRTIPILIGASSDPVELGLAESLAHPGGNVTGFISMQIETTVKYLELIKELDPSVTRVLVVMNAKDPSNLRRMRAIEAGGPSLRVAVSQTDLSLAPDIDRVIGDFASAPAGGLIVLPSTLTISKMGTIVMLTAQHRLPAIYPFRSWAAAGGLVAYGSDQADQFRRAASYADRILRGEKPADLPIQAPAKFELIVNLKTARALGLAIPPTFLARADEVIE